MKCRFLLGLGMLALSTAGFAQSTPSQEVVCAKAPTFYATTIFQPTSDFPIAVGTTMIPFGMFDPTAKPKGFSLNSDGTILTCKHPVSGNDSYRVEVKVRLDETTPVVGDTATITFQSSSDLSTWTDDYNVRGLVLGQDVDTVVAFPISHKYVRMLLSQYMGTSSVFMPGNSTGLTLNIISQQGPKGQR